MSSTATDSALTFWDLDTRRSGPTIPANVTSASWSGRNLFVGNWLAKPVVNSTCVSPAWNGVRQVLPRVHGLSGLHCSNTRMARIYSTFCACRPFLLTGVSVDRPETRVLFPSHSPLTQAPSRPYTALRGTSCRVPIWVVRGSEGRERSNGPAAQASPESHHVWLDPQVRDRWETSARRYHQVDKQSVEYFALCVGH